MYIEFTTPTLVRYVSAYVTRYQKSNVATLIDICKYVANVALFDDVACSGMQVHGKLMMW